MANKTINDLVLIGTGGEPPFQASTQFETDTGGTTSNKATASQIKTFVENGLVVSNATGILNARIDNVQTLSANYSVVDADNNKLFLITTSTNDIIITLPDPTTTVLGTRIGFLKVDNTLGIVKFTKTPAVFWELSLQNDFLEIVNTGVDWAIVSFGNYFLDKSVKHYFHDFTSVTGLEFGGTFAAFTATGTTTTFNVTAGQAGVVALATGAVANGFAGLLLGTNSSNFAFIQNGNFTGIYKCYVQVPTLSDALQEFDAFFGFMSIFTTAAPGQGAYFQYDTNQSNNWLCVTANSSIRTTVDSGVAVSTSFVKLEVRFNNTEARFYINDTFITTISTNLPTGAFSFGLSILKSVGTTSRSIRIDWSATDINLGNLNRGI